MDQQLQMHLNLASLLLERWMVKGPQVWDATGRTLLASSVDINGTSWEGSELSSFCIELKRRGDYAGALGGYLQLAAACLEERGKIPTYVMRGMWKVLVCANAFALASSMAGTILADLQNDASAMATERLCFDDYWLGLVKLAVNVIDNNDDSGVQAYCANFSGNPFYTLVQSRSEIRSELSIVRERVRKVYKF